MEEPDASATRSQKQAQKRGDRHSCFEELRRLVGPWNDTRIYELKVLDNSKRCPPASSLGA